ncbi:MAG: hypothetical protein QME74_05425 [Candidatus Edwardsbacteria bacterium]|nr:hypothetical protein [Candidatus Edwardsbacteria bacterium]
MALKADIYFYTCSLLLTMLNLCRPRSANRQRRPVGGQFLINGFRRDIGAVGPPNGSIYDVEVLHSYFSAA